MLTRSEFLFKWLRYAAAAALCLLVQGALLQRVTVWGVLPFLYPLLAAIPATYEGPLSGAIFGLCVGVVCDLLLPGTVPCLHTLVFPLVGLCAGLLAQSLLPAGIPCSLLTSALAFLLTDGLRCFLLWATGRSAWKAGGYLLVRELCVTLPLALPVTWLFRSVARKTHPRT